TDLSPARRAQADFSGFQVFDPEPDLVTGFNKRVPKGADIVVDATGAAPALAQTVQLGRCLPWDHQLHSPTRFVMQGSYSQSPAFSYDAAFDRELHLLVPRDNRRADVSAVLALMARGLLNPLP
ncbi:hypothetical protein RZS08_23320, partial [Arthrospira platensis SPKY1]|nr:hypothetical protein [Arthrospira platensis SPKY1]